MARSHFTKTLSGESAAGECVGGSRRARKGNGFPDEQFFLERTDHCRSLSLPMADREVFQGTKTDFAVSRLSGSQRRSGEMANLDRAADLSVVTLLRFLIAMEPQFHSLVCVASFSPV